MTFFELTKKFPNDKAVTDYFVNIRYNGTLVCPHCGATVKVYRYKNRMKVCQCDTCNKSFSIFKKTIFEKSSTKLVKWMYAIHLFLNGKKGISAYQLQREIGVSYPTAWRILKQIRLAMGNVDMTKVFTTLVEVDETYVGGKPRKENQNGKPKTPAKRGRGTTKTPVIGIKERDTGNVYTQVAEPDAEGKKLTSKQLRKVIGHVVKDGTTVVTDDFTSYNFMDHPHKEKYIHLSVNHSAGQFSDCHGTHTNGVEGFWSILKRSIFGVYHHVSKKYLQQYANECCFRQNNRGGDAFDVLVGQCVLKAA